jgi:hypothetical protein
MLTRRAWLCGMVASVGAAGCRPTPSAPSGTGAREAALTFYRAIVHKDWAGAHAALHSDSRNRLSRDQFAVLATAYRGRLPFDPSGVQLSACEEKEDSAVAHVVLTGRSAHQRYKDAASLRRGTPGWGIVLPANFGKPRPR